MSILPAPALLRCYVESEGLLAKWRMENDTFQWARGRTFNGHLGEVMSACDFLFSEPYHGHTSFGWGLYDVMHLHRYVTFEEFQRWCELGTLAHDLGKSSGEFQSMLWGLEHSYRTHLANTKDVDILRTRMASERRYKQAYRHEFMSAVLMWVQPEIRAWFLEQAGSYAGFGYVIAGAFGHHIKADFAKCHPSLVSPLLHAG